MPRGIPKSGHRIMKPGFKPGPEIKFTDAWHATRREASHRHYRRMKVSDEELERKLNGYFERQNKPATLQIRGWS